MKLKCFVISIKIFLKNYQIKKMFSFCIANAYRIRPNSLILFWLHNIQRNFEILINFWSIKWNLVEKKEKNIRILFRKRKNNQKWSSDVFRIVYWGKKSKVRQYFLIKIRRLLITLVYLLNIRTTTN